MSTPEQLTASQSDLQTCAHCASTSLAENEGEANDAATRRRNTWRIVSISVAAALLVLGIVFESFLHDTPYNFAEYLVFIPAYLLAGLSVLAAAARNIVRGRVFDEMLLLPRSLKPSRRRLRPHIPNTD